MARILPGLVVYIVIVYLQSAETSYQQYFSSQWYLNETTGKYSNLTAKVPGGIYTDLMDNGVIGDVFYGYNDTASRWVANSDWVYYTTFNVDNSILSYDTINLVFEGLDTFATISVNGKEMGKSENMFVRYIFDIKSSLKAGDNSLNVRFESPIKVAADLAQNSNYTIPPNCPPDQYRGECHANQIRKMQASFSWDWGPAFPSVGIWKNVYMEGFNTAVLRYVTFTAEEAPGDYWSINVSSYLAASQSLNLLSGTLEYTLQTDVSQVSQIAQINHVPGEGGEVRVDHTFSIPKITVKRWWPNGYGDQQLYNLNATFKSDGEQTSMLIRIGFRTIELVQHELEDDTPGLTFYFKVNGIAIFAKGANEIPLDILPEKGQNPDVVLRILGAAKETNMNMLRVWGGGVYESDFFYNMADEFGILIWQDFMFACAMYPSRPEFLSNVMEEVKHQVRRLISHPSIALWTGNNENEAALVQNWYGTADNFDLYKKDFIKLYVDTIRAEVQNISAQLIFLTSSPTDGKESEKQGYVAENPQDPLYGDVHFYNYLLNSLDASTYPVPRFMSEFGYQSLPDVDTWMSVTSNLSDLQPYSTFMDHRQHHPGGLPENLLLINYQLHLNSSSPNFYKAFIFYSQIIQALSIKFESELYRSYMGRLNDKGQGLTMGALFWQLNDVWVAPTWSGIDYTGKWKMLQYFAKDFFSPTIITGHLDIARQLKIYVVSEVIALTDSELDATAVVSVYNWNSFQPVNTTNFTINLEYGKAIEVTTIDADPFLFNSASCGSLDVVRNNCFFTLNLIRNSVNLAPSNFISVGKLKDSNLALQPNLKISSVTQVDAEGKKFEISIESDKICLFVWLDAHKVKGLFSENGFVQLSSNKTVFFQAEKITNVEELNKSVTVTHLQDSQYL